MFGSVFYFKIGFLLLPSQQLCGKLKPVLPLSATLMFPRPRPKRKAPPYLKHTNTEELTGLFWGGEPEPRSLEPGCRWMEKASPGLQIQGLECILEMCVRTWKSRQISVDGAVSVMNFNMRNLITAILLLKLTHLLSTWTSRCAHSHSSGEHR